MDIAYTAEATSSGDARNGSVRSADGILEHDLRMPAELGGSGGATNPEQLFAAGYSACFHQALKLAAKNAGVSLSGDSVKASVGIGPEGDSFGLAVTLEAALPGVQQAQADSLMQRAHELCPYSKATRGNVDVTLRATT